MRLLHLFRIVEKLFWNFSTNISSGISPRNRSCRQARTPERRRAHHGSHSTICSSCSSTATAASRELRSTYYYCSRRERPFFFRSGSRRRRRRWLSSNFFQCCNRRPSGILLAQCEILRRRRRWCQGYRLLIKRLATSSRHQNYFPTINSIHRQRATCCPTCHMKEKVIG